jgi:pyrimidine-nucleoside phosphorylase
MRAVEIIKKKRDGEDLSRAEIDYLIHGICAGTIPDYQTAAFLMAVFFRGMSSAEMSVFTEEMRRSGSVIDLTDIPGRKVDKHSTGGVGDKTSLVVAPALAAAGLVVPMVSGRGLAHTGGTLDKLESIRGFDVRLDPRRFVEVLKEIGVAVVGQGDNLVPADRRLYALRDVTATVDSLPLMASSIMSKKLAEGVDALVLDVKTGSGAFAKTAERAEALARAMVSIGRSFGKNVVALITDMSQPLGRLAGNALEVVECLEVLKGRGPADLIRLCRELSAHAMLAAESVASLEQGRERYDGVVASGAALSKFRDIVRCQGGDVRTVDDYSLFPQAAHQAAVAAPVRGYVESIDAEKVGWAVNLLGAGREHVDSPIDHAVGMQMNAKIGDWVERGAALCTLHYNDPQRLGRARELLGESYRLCDDPPALPELIRKVIT